ncbi:MAG: GNAT family N-acetyltransferase [Firmicutes bacterium]|nr:GNAT family N-acetyltransferase [Bacillota bacterium]
MVTIRLAQIGDMPRQKEIWKLCFGDSDLYIDFYYANHYKAEETMLLLDGAEIACMLTMLPIETIAADQCRWASAMLYAIATHPQYQRRGLATQLINNTHDYLRQKEKVFSLLVPSQAPLFDFYSLQGYQDGFYIREILFTREQIENWDAATSCLDQSVRLDPHEYNLVRNEQLRGMLYVAYPDEEIAYQAQLSRQFGGDLFAITIGEERGCAVLETLPANQVFIRELLISEQHLPAALRHLAQLLPAAEYIVRIPAFLGARLGGTSRPFAMLRPLQPTAPEITPTDLGYLGLAFD